MPRNLVVCTDGTWNRPDRRDHGVVVPSNVVKVARAVAGQTTDGTEQCVYYHAGVGTGDRWDRIKGGAFGIGLSDNIKKAYVALGKVFSPGDRIFLFGFSRGAYTARSLAGLIGLCGIPKRGNHDIADVCEQAFRIYRMNSGTGMRCAAAKRHVAEFSYVNDDGKKVDDIHFIGVWDTVGALGIPFTIFRAVNQFRFQFHDIELGSHIRHAYHALAIDERRSPFRPTLWQSGSASGTQVVEQLWFPGVHCNVGGGYADQGLSDRAFLWICVKAQEAGLGFRVEYMNRRIDPNYHGELRNSRVGFHRFLPSKTRVIGNANVAGEAIHYSAEERFSHPTETDYREGHAGKNLGPALENARKGGRPGVAPALEMEKVIHGGPIVSFWNDGGGSPASFS